MIQNLCDLDAVLNYVWHRVEDRMTAVSSPYTVSSAQLESILNWLTETELSSRVRLYFDDNDLSFFERVLSVIDVSSYFDVVLAVPAVSVDSRGHGTMEDLARAVEAGVRIAAHGMTHVRLASYLDGVLLPTPSGGRYETVEPDVEDPLNENQVLFQLIESKEALAVYAPAEFVLPYGCFNRFTVVANERFGIYDFLGTSDFDLDVGQPLRPRRIVTSETSSSDLEDEVLSRLGLS
jgi:hypothetical protein